MLSLIFDDALYFSFCDLFHLFKWCNVIGRPSITMTDGFPGGHLAVVKILSVGGGGQYTFPATADVSDAQVYLEYKNVFFHLCSWLILKGHWLVFTTSV